ncbi:phosphate propanoyltransferase [Companilactobacillus zhongbaensis]|uniref:phosphate propanoyltransferase n=1 Tax=Companilactobacillus zhongbaensis TaxID=2486009 RepID=UPI000F7A1B79|nr:phosphate propanoyltransferase [Companilactobacillus zhongbaensis]
MNDEQLRTMIRRIISEELNNDDGAIDIGVSNHHIHLSEEDFATLFPGQKFELYRQLKQPADFAAKQTVTLVGPNGFQIPHVRLLGPARSHSQIEISRTEARQLDIDAPIRLSGNLDGTPSLTVKSDNAEIKVQGVIAAKRHIHMSLADAEKYGVKYGDTVKVKIQSKDRCTIYGDVIARPREDFVTEMHIDTDEANAANVQSDTKAYIIQDDDNK